MAKEGEPQVNRRDGYLFRVLQNSKKTEYQVGAEKPAP